MRLGPNWPFRADADSNGCAGQAPQAATLGTEPPAATPDPAHPAFTFDEELALYAQAVLRKDFAAMRAGYIALRDMCTAARGK